MLLVDDILTFPVSSILWIFREINKIAQEELDSEGQTITEQLRLLYMQLETGRITEEQFDAEEKVLLDRLDAIDSRLAGGEDSEDQDITATEEETYKP
jgi:Gas vesicle protein G